MPNPKSFISLCMLAGLLFAVGCKKEDKTEKFTFVNTMDKPVHIDVYRTPEDYNARTNIYISQTVPAKESFAVSKESIQNSKFYADWYSTDYTYSNWGSSSQYDVPNSIPIGFNGYSDDRFVMYIPALSMARIVCLKGDEMETHWKAIDAFDFDGQNNVWSSLNAWEKGVELVIRRDMRITVIAKDAQQNAIAHTGSLSTQMNLGNPFIGIDGDIMFSNSTSNSAADYTNGTMTKDSLILLYGVYNYRMVRK